MPDIRGIPDLSRLRQLQVLHTATAPFKSVTSCACLPLGLTRLELDVCTELERLHAAFGQLTRLRGLSSWTLGLHIIETEGGGLDPLPPPIWRFYMQEGSCRILQRCVCPGFRRGSVH